MMKPYLFRRVEEEVEKQGSQNIAFDQGTAERLGGDLGRQNDRQASVRRRAHSVVCAGTVFGRAVSVRARNDHRRQRPICDRGARGLHAQQLAGQLRRGQHGVHSGGRRRGGAALDFVGSLPLGVSKKQLSALAHRGLDHRRVHRGRGDGAFRLADRAGNPQGARRARGRGRVQLFLPRLIRRTAAARNPGILQRAEGLSGALAGQRAHGGDPDSGRAVLAGSGCGGCGGGVRRLSAHTPVRHGRVRRGGRGGGAERPELCVRRGGALRRGGAVLALQ